MKAARNFTHGIEDSPNHRYKVGDEVPDEVVEALGGQANSLILELAAENNPDVLSRAQLLDLAGMGSSDDDDDDQETVPKEFDEENFREGMVEFTTKGDLVEWAESVLGIQGLESSWTRTEIEDSLAAAYTESDSEPEE